MIVHKRKIEKLYNKLETERKSKDHILALTFDFMKTVSLPKIPVQELYYLRQLYLNIFCIHDIKKNTGSIYLYHEGNGKKGPNKVCSFIRTYILDVLKSHPNQYTEVHLY